MSFFLDFIFNIIIFLLKEYILIRIILISFILIGSICSQDFDQDGIVDLNDWSTLAAVLGDSTTGIMRGGGAGIGRHGTGTIK